MHLPAVAFADGIQSVSICSASVTVKMTTAESLRALGGLATIPHLNRGPYFAEPPTPDEKDFGQGLARKFGPRKTVFALKPLLDVRSRLEFAQNMPRDTWQENCHLRWDFLKNRRAVIPENDGKRLGIHVENVLSFGTIIFTGTVDSNALQLWREGLKKHKNS
ncbi:unnamed protein product, partial [Amoebophrya sp. A25]|eukprot:GSA25T00025502001.1